MVLKRFKGNKTAMTIVIAIIANNKNYYYWWWCVWCYGNCFIIFQSICYFWCKWSQYYSPLWTHEKQV